MHNVFAIAGTADELVRHRGRCQSLAILDRRDAVRCADEMLVQTGDGQRGFVFSAGETVLLFVKIARKADGAGLRDLPISRIEFGVGSQVETRPVLSGACRWVDPAATWREETVCEAETAKGRFAAQFVTIVGVANSEQPERGRR